jgi:diguanylate cyclase (GGDEF)-like protein
MDCAFGPPRRGPVLQGQYGRTGGRGICSSRRPGREPCHACDLESCAQRRRPAGEGTSAGAERLTLAERLEEATRQLELTRALLAEKQRECHELASALAQDAHFDTLTGLFNRRKFNELFAAEIARSVRYATPLALIMVDIDHFKRVNDEHGHLMGDRALVDVARVLSGRMRTSDALCRWGGEEFMIVAPHLDLACAVRMADKLRLAIALADFGPAGR